MGKKQGGGKREGGQERSPSGWDVGSGRNPDDPTGNGVICIVLPQQFSERLMPLEGTTWTRPADGLKPLSLRSPLALKMKPGLPEALPVPGWPTL